MINKVLGTNYKYISQYYMDIYDNKNPIVGFKISDEDESFLWTETFNKSNRTTVIDHFESDDYKLERVDGQILTLENLYKYSDILSENSDYRGF